jgi:hypothetical protein
MALQSTELPEDLFRMGRGGVAHNREKVRRYRWRAEELRAIAQDWIDGEAQSALFKIARDYERMANTLEQMDAPIGKIANLGEPHEAPSPHYK